MLVPKKSAGFTPDVNLRNVLCQMMKHAIEGIIPGFETQGRRHQKFKTGVSVALQKGLMSSNFILKKQKKTLFTNADLCNFRILIATLVFEYLSLWLTNLFYRTEESQHPISRHRFTKYRPVNL